MSAYRIEIYEYAYYFAAAKTPTSATSQIPCKQIQHTPYALWIIDGYLHTLATKSLIARSFYQILLDPSVRLPLRQVCRPSRGCTPSHPGCARGNCTQVGLDEKHNRTSEHGGKGPSRSISLIQFLLWHQTALPPTTTKDANQYHCRIYHEPSIRLLITMKDGAQAGAQEEVPVRFVNHSTGGLVRPTNGSMRDLHLLLQGRIRVSLTSRHPGTLTNHLYLTMMERFHRLMRRIFRRRWDLLV